MLINDEDLTINKHYNRVRGERQKDIGRLNTKMEPRG